MNPRRKRRLIGILVIIIGLGIATVIATRALRENLLYFVSPTEVYNEQLPPGRQFRLGGLVRAGSVARASDGLEVKFVVTDGLKDVDVTFDGILPDLFRENQGVIAIGSLDDDKKFVAHEVLAKHDENYMPPEVADALEKAGHASMENKE